MIDSFTIQTASESASASTFGFVILLSFVLSTALAVVYQKTFRGLSYSRNYVQSIVLISIVAATVMQAVGDSLARGIGIMASMAIIRFRTNFKDPRDTLFLFASLAAGIACGSYALVGAVFGTVGFCLAALLLYHSPLGPENYFDGMLRFSMPTEGEGRVQLEAIMGEHCKAFSLVTLRDVEQGVRMDHAYHVKLRRGRRHEDFLSALKGVQSIRGLHLMMQEATVDL